jgi:hypothetical protein
MLIVTLAKRSGHWQVVQGWALFAVVGAAISLPGLVTAGKLATVAGSAIGGVVDLGLGNLAAPVSRWAAAGVYLTGDYRYPLVHVTASHVFDVLILVLAALGVLAAIMRRRWTIVVLGVSAPIALYYFIEHSTAWIQLKSFTITAAFSVLPSPLGERPGLAWRAGDHSRGPLRQRPDLPRHLDRSRCPLPRPCCRRGTLCGRGTGA